MHENYHITLMKNHPKNLIYVRVQTSDFEAQQVLRKWFQLILVKNATISQWFLKTVANSFSLFLGSIVVDVFVILLY